MKKAAPTTKRGGVRRAVKRRPVKSADLLVKELYKDKGRGIFPKALGQYRFVICTDLDADHVAALSMFTGWVKANETFFDSRNNFPIYGFIFSGEGDREKKTTKIYEFLAAFGELLQWNDPEHHLYKGFQRVGENVWCDDELEIEELKKVKASNLFFLYLNKPSFLEGDSPVVEYLVQAPGVICSSGSGRFFKRGKSDGPLVVVDPAVIVGDSDILTPHNPRLFRRLEDDEETELVKMISAAMYAENDCLFEEYTAVLREYEAFNDTDFDEHKSFLRSMERLDSQKKKDSAMILRFVDTNIKHQSQQLNCKGPLGVVALLVASGTLMRPPFRLERVEDSNTYCLAVKEGHVKTIHKLIEDLLLTAFHLF